VKDIINFAQLSHANLSNKSKKAISIFFIMVLSMILLTGCGLSSTTEPAPDEVSHNEYYYSFKDSLDNLVNLESKPNRVVSLVGSYSETWVLAGGELVGVTNDVISERNMDLPLETQIVGTIKEPNIEEIIAISPDFVILSPDIESHIEVSNILKEIKIAHAFFKVEHFEDYLSMLDICTDITGFKDLYEKNGLEVKTRIDNVLQNVSDKKKPEILLLRAFSSGAKAKDDDNNACRILNDLGTVNIASKHESLLEDLSMEVIIKEDPDYIFVVTMGDSDKALKNLRESIEKNPAWSELSAVKNQRYIVLPKELFHYKPNARWGESYEYIAKILYPDEFR
jgi:iron complex transport system substrate-binding protein